MQSPVLLALQFLGLGLSWTVGWQLARLNDGFQFDHFAESYHSIYVGGPVSRKDLEVWHAAAWQRSSGAERLTTELPAHLGQVGGPRGNRRSMQIT